VLSTLVKEVYFVAINQIVKHLFDDRFVLQVRNRQAAIGKVALFCQRETQIITNGKSLNQLIRVKA